MKKSNLSALIEFRIKKIIQLEEKKLHAEELANSIFGFVVKHHFKPTAKAQTRAQILLNYYYWTTFIERKVVMEQHLIDMGLGTSEQLLQTVRIYSKRRDKMVTRLLSELKEKPLRITQISDDHFEVILADESILFAGKEAIAESGVSLFEKGSPTFPIYSSKFILPF